MTIDQLRRLKHLSEIPTHSAESLEELKDLVRMATLDEFVANSELEGFCGLKESDGGPCNNCVNLVECEKSLRNAEKCLPEYLCFELKMEGE